MGQKSALSTIPAKPRTIDVENGRDGDGKPRSAMPFPGIEAECGGALRLRHNAMSMSMRPWREKGRLSVPRWKRTCWISASMYDRIRGLFMSDQGERRNSTVWVVSTPGAASLNTSKANSNDRRSIQLSPSTITASTVAAGFTRPSTARRSQRWKLPMISPVSGVGFARASRRFSTVTDWADATHFAVLKTPPDRMSVMFRPNFADGRGPISMLPGQRSSARKMDIEAHQTSSRAPAASARSCGSLTSVTRPVSK